MSQLQMMDSTGAVQRPLADRSGAVPFPTDSTAGIIHDLGNLIQIASSAVNIVARNSSTHSAELEPVIAGARSSLERAGALVRQTIGIVRGATAAEEVNLAECLRGIEALLQVAWEPSIHLDFQIVTDLPLVECDPLALQNAVLNLLFNARDAMPDGGTVAIRTDVIPLDAGEAIELRVTDSGVGMKPETVGRAFDLFFTTKSDGLGGVGLPMVKRFVHDVGGRILIESEYGVGTTVTLQLPTSARSEASSQPPK